MLTIGRAWRDWVGYSNFGVAYFGSTIKPVHVRDNIYQVKCMCAKSCNRSEYEMKYLQIDFDKANITLDFLIELSNNYIKEVGFCGYYTDNPNVYIAEEFNKPRNVIPNRYNAKRIHSLFKRLNNLKQQSKPILK